QRARRPRPGGVSLGSSRRAREGGCAPYRAPCGKGQRITPCNSGRRTRQRHRIGPLGFASLGEPSRRAVFEPVRHKAYLRSLSYTFLSRISAMALFVEGAFESKTAHECARGKTKSPHDDRAPCS